MALTLAPAKETVATLQNQIAEYCTNYELPVTLGHDEYMVKAQLLAAQFFLNVCRNTNQNEKNTITFNLEDKPGEENADPLKFDLVQNSMAPSGQWFTRFPANMAKAAAVVFVSKYAICVTQCMLSALEYRFALDIIGDEIDPKTLMLEAFDEANKVVKLTDDTPGCITMGELAAVTNLHSSVFVNYTIYTYLFLRGLVVRKYCYDKNNIVPKEEPSKKDDNKKDDISNVPSYVID